MNHNAKWARDNLEDASRLTDSELIQISEKAWRRNRGVMLACFTVGVVIISRFDDRVSHSLLGHDAAFWQTLLVAGAMGGMLGAVVHLIFQPFLRSHIRELVGRE